jgi:hypothetical protein
MIDIIPIQPLDFSGLPQPLREKLNGIVIETTNTREMSLKLNAARLEIKSDS